MWLLYVLSTRGHPNITNTHLNNQQVIAVMLRIDEALALVTLW